MRRLAGSVERKPDGSWTIPANHEANGAAFNRTRDTARIDLLSPVPVERLRTARAQTWLDRELVADVSTPASEKGFGHEVRQGLARRRAFLIAEGLATRDGDRIYYSRDMLVSLREQELARASAELGKAIGKPYSLAVDGKLDGVYRRPVQLVSGKFAVVERSRDFTLVPWRPVLDRQIGKAVHGTVRGQEVSWSLGRMKGPNIT
jgi:hypothetical protein